MKSIKPGRAPSKLGFIGGICAALFGVGWIIAALAIGAGPFALFGIPFVVIAVANTVYNYRNAHNENRYSEFDIVDEGEEPDPLNEAVKPASQAQPQDPAPSATRAYCPYCGAKTAPDHNFCQSCGKRLP